MGNQENNQGDKGNKGRPYKAGYEYLLVYKITVPIEDYTDEFCKRWIDKFSRTHDQMVQAARSGSRNIVEGNQQEGLKGYIKLAGIARGSLAELLKDYHGYARKNGLEVWEKERCEGEIREIGEVWGVIRKTPTLPDNPDFPDLPENQEIAVNLMITLINQALYLQDRFITSLKDKHMKEGGLTEELYRKRMEYRRNQNP